MVLTSLVAGLAALSRRQPEPPESRAEATVRILDELFAVWPLDPEEERAVRARYGVPAR